MPEPSHYIQHQRQQHTHDNRSRQGKIEGRVFPAIENVARQSPQREIRPAQHHEYEPGCGNCKPENEEHLPDVGHAYSLEDAGYAV